MVSLHKDSIKFVHYSGKQLSSSTPEQQQSPSAESAPTTEIDGSQLIREIEAFYSSEQHTEKAREAMDRSHTDLKSSMHERMKDKSEGKKMLADMGASMAKLQQFLHRVEKHQNK